jgi:hypothetical protein
MAWPGRTGWEHLHVAINHASRPPRRVDLDKQFNDESSRPLSLGGLRVLSAKP